MSNRPPDPDELLREVAERPPRPSRSALAPYAGVIEEMRRGGYTLLEIQALLRTRTGVSRSVSTLQEFIARTAERQRTERRRSEKQNRKQTRPSKKPAAIGPRTDGSAASMPPTKVTPTRKSHSSQSNTQPKRADADQPFEFDASQPFEP